MNSKARHLVFSTIVIVPIILTSSLPVFATQAAAQTNTSNQTVNQTEQKEKTVTVGTVKTVSTSLNVRAAASTEAKIVGKLQNKTTVIIEKTQGNWHYITYGSLKGWVSGDFITNIVQKKESEVNRGAGTADREQVQEMLQFAQSLLGSPYKSGGSSPKGFDCSGYVTYVFNHYGISVPRSSADYPSFGQKVSRADLLPGDIICSDTVGKIDGKVSHVAIYMGSGKFIHASSGSKKIQINSLSEEYYDKRYVCAIRVLN